MNNSRFFGMILLQLTIFLSSSSAEGTILCVDNHQYCPSYERMCNNISIRNGCRLTCGICQPNQCTANNGGCEQICSWTGIETRCSCFDGYRLASNGRTCEDINECEQGPNPCITDPRTHCVNTVGSYSCEENTCSHTMGQMNYFGSGECCNVQNGSCGMTAYIETALNRVRANPIIRIVGGRVSSFSSWPWQAQIIFEGQLRCGASLIANQWLIGAAHCFERHSYQEMIVYMGQIRNAEANFSYWTRRIIRSISNVIVPPGASRYVDDIALIELSSPVTFSDVVRPICLPCGEEPTVGTKCWATGFGRTESGQESVLLREIDLPIIDHNTCQRAYQGLFNISEQKSMCAGYSEGIRNTCRGDSGGPLACQRADSCQWYLNGVTSFSRGCAIPGYYGVYTKVVSYERWLRENLRARNVTGLCERFLNPCRYLSNVADNCYDMLGHCTTYPHYMKANCALACCQLRHNEISDCHDDPAYEEMCESLKDQCNLPRIGTVIRATCRKTCKVC